MGHSGSIGSFGSIALCDPLGYSTFILDLFPRFNTTTRNGVIRFRPQPMSHRSHCTWRSHLYGFEIIQLSPMLMTAPYLLITWSNCFMIGTHGPRPVGPVWTNDLIIEPCIGSNLSYWNHWSHMTQMCSGTSHYRHTRVTDSIVLRVTGLVVVLRP